MVEEECPHSLNGIAPITMVLINDESQHKRIPTIACADNFKQTTEAHQWEKLYGSHGEPRHLCIIPLKNFHLFKITESVFKFYLKLYNFK